MTAARIRLVALAAVLVVAGALPWLTGGPTAARLLGLPFILLGVLAAYATTRITQLAQRPAPAPAGPSGGCDSCVCGGGACGRAPGDQVEPSSP